MNHLVDLTGAWTLHQADRPDLPPLPAILPGEVHSALLAAGRIPDPYYDRNEFAVSWVGQADWTYERTVDLPADLATFPSVALELEHVDTFATVLVNGQEVGQTGNRFRRYRFEVGRLLRPGANTFTLRFRSAERLAAEQAAALSHPIPHIYKGPRGAWAKKGINLIRKPQCHGGWDWGPALMLTGVAGACRLIAARTARIEAVWCTQDHQPGSCLVQVCTEVWSPAGGPAELAVELGPAALHRSVHLQPGLNRLEASLAIAEPRLWWPNGEGEQYLYPLRVQIGGSLLERRLGLRRLEVIRQKDAAGASFGFRINGRTVFAKGANWIPCEGLAQRQTRQRLAGLLGSAAAAHMNMVRVWGGGQYESDDFYELCDQLGLLVWQDMMFSCATYPDSREFLDEVAVELEHQIKRLRDHACLALWCGDNECLGALGWFQESRDRRDRYVVAYDRLLQVKAAAVAAHDPCRIFWPSSPCAGPDDFADGWREDGRGDMHMWDVWHQSKDFERYQEIRPRFCSEFGFQSFNGPEVVAAFCPADQRNPTSAAFEHHQKNPGGNARILETMTRYFRFPSGFENVLYLSQLQQALAIRTAVLWWRHLQPHCLGTLYWQLNDMWPVASWASLEWNGRWKMLHHHARRFYAALAGCLLPGEGQGRSLDPQVLTAWVLNDRSQAVAVEACLTVWTYAGCKVSQHRWTATVAAQSATCLGRCGLAELVADEAAGEQQVAILDLTWPDGIQRIEHPFTRWKHARLAPATVTATVVDSPTGPQVRLSSDAPAFFVWLATPGLPGEFSDNSLILLPGETRILAFHAPQPVTAADLRRCLEVRHLRQTYD